MKRSDFMKAVLAIPVAVFGAKAAKPDAEPVPPTVKTDPEPIVAALKANAHLLPHINPEDMWPAGCYGCCIHRGKGACDLCRRRGADTQADRRMDERTLKAMRGKPGWVEEAEGVFLNVERDAVHSGVRVYAQSFMSPHQLQLMQQRAAEYVAYLDELRDAGFWDRETGLLSKDFKAIGQRVQKREVG